jgi:hypothetical protein
MSNEVRLNLPFLGGRQSVTRESNPVAYAYAVHGSDLGGNLDQARVESWEQDWNELQRERRRRSKDWHYDVPLDHWRTRDGRALPIRQLEDRHLGHCIRFAQTKKPHASRLSALLTEQDRRKKVASRLK